MVFIVVKIVVVDPVVVDPFQGVFIMVKFVVAPFVHGVFTMVKPISRMPIMVISVRCRSVMFPRRVLVNPTVPGVSSVSLPRNLIRRLDRNT